MSMKTSAWVPWTLNVLAVGTQLVLRAEQGEGKLTSSWDGRQIGLRGSHQLHTDKQH